jgi:hypothetical protein
MAGMILPSTSPCGLASRFPGIARVETLRAVRQMGLTCLDDCYHLPRARWTLTPEQTAEVLAAMTEAGRQRSGR